MGIAAHNETEESDEAAAMDMNLEVVTIPVTDVDRAFRFYQSLGWRLDADYEAKPGGYRIVQFTPPGSGCSIQFGREVTPAAAGSAQNTYLVVRDIATTRAWLTSKGVEVSEIFHRVYDTGDQVQVEGPDPHSPSYHSFATFSDPDGNGWLLQQVQVRETGR
ncbi:VOC family protein [Streptomyces fructofermentans]|uniref:VOC family protein n=1 Tax=Streptomyces fructofermentans TaxID=152141 RepID=UPI0033EEC9DE